jgi:O-antigen ligase
VIADHPLLGVGGGNWPLTVGSASLGVSRFWFLGHSHSLPLQLGVELGAIGVLLGGVFFAAPLWLARRNANRSAAWQFVAAGATCGVLGLLAHDVVHYFLRQPADGIPTGLLLGLAVRAARAANVS